MNLILNLDNNQEKELLVLLKNVFLKQINNIMLLNLLNKKKEKLILMKYKLDNKFKIYLMLFNIMIFIFDKLINNYKNNILILL